MNAADLEYALERIVSALDGGNALPYTTPDGKYVGSVTEAGIYIAKTLERVATAIEDLTAAIQDREGK